VYHALSDQRNLFLIREQSGDYKEMQEQLIRRNTIEPGGAVGGDLYFDIPKEQRKGFRAEETRLAVVIRGTTYECVGDRIWHTICCSRTMDLGLHIAVHARKKSLLRHTGIRCSSDRWAT
jgi:hypothetical protein